MQSPAAAKPNSPEREYRTHAIGCRKLATNPVYTIALRNMEHLAPSRATTEGAIQFAAAKTA